ncbi:protein Mpv17-like isoform X2 [Pomacea canaliculata]|nr:protein Mpv17-like isoform X2 [Pomacea canaliculata]XP_025089437.1 protein Mpv17-like isoform X2 [Pomacea canaliculata]
MMRYWYLCLDKMYAGTRYAPFKMVLTDQMIGAPIVITTFLAGLGILKGEDSKQIVQKIKMNFVPLMINNYKIWPAAQIINFYFMPLQHRVLFVNFVALGWNTFLAWFSERSEQR